MKNQLHSRKIAYGTLFKSLICCLFTFSFHLLRVFWKIITFEAVFDTLTLRRANLGQKNATVGIQIMQLWFPVAFSFLSFSLDHHEEVLSEFGSKITLECNTYDHRFVYIEWKRNDSHLPVIKKFQDDPPVVAKEYENRASLVNGKDLLLTDLHAKDESVYHCRTAFQTGNTSVAVHHSTFWDLKVQHDGKLFCVGFVIFVILRSIIWLIKVNTFLVI